MSDGADPDSRNTTPLRWGRVSWSGTDARLGSSIGPYRLIEFLGAGGMGTVYLAEQVEPVVRKVALKLVQTHRGGPAAGFENDLRFAAERQALARLSHPNVAQLYESGETPEGVPYFAMEYVEGSSITRFCDARRLDLRGRLEVFLAVCRGVEHAHQKGVLHRDLKPDNVLVALPDGEPVPKIIDFGIAKGIDEPLAEVTQLTQQGVVGTLAYLSPETIRAAQGESDVDTRADVFSLGILLHELLVGARPQDFGSESTAEILERILAADLPAPSRHFAALSENEQERFAEDRQSTARRLGGDLRRDLDWIVMRACAADRSQRYPAAGQLADEIGRYLADQPIQAGPPDRVYRLRKFVRRNRSTVVAAVLVGLTLLLGFVGTAVGLVRARAAQRLAEEKTRTAVAAVAESDSVLDFVVELFEASAPGQERQDLEPVGAVLERGAAQLEDSLADQPRVRARLLVTLGRIFNQLGNYPVSTRLLTESLEVHERLTDGRPSRDLVSAADQLGRIHVQAGRYRDAERVFRQAIAMHEQISPGEPSFELLGNMVNALRRLGKIEEALSVQRQVVQLVENDPEQGPQPRAQAMANLAESFGALKRTDEAIEAYARAVTLARESSNTLLVGQLLLNSSIQVNESGNYELAEEQILESHELLVQAAGPDHPYSLAAASMMAHYQGRSDIGAARRTLTDLLPRVEKAFGADHVNSITIAWNVALTYLDAGEFEEAAARVDAVLRRRVASESRNPDQKAGMAASLALAHCHLEELEAARRALTALEEAEQAPELGPTGLGRGAVGCVQLLAGDLEAARATLAHGVELIAEESAPSPRVRGQLQLLLAKALFASEEAAEAEVYLSQAREAFREAPAPNDHWQRMVEQVLRE